MAEIDFSKYGGSPVSSDSGSSLDFSKYGAAPSVSPSLNEPPSTGIDFSKYGGSNGAADSSPSGWNGILDNPIGRGIGDILGAVGHGFNALENATGLNHVAGAMKGISDPQQFFSNPWQNDGSYLGGYKDAAGSLLSSLGNIGKSAYEGFVNPDQATTKFNTDLNNATQNLDPVTRAGLNFEAGAGTDPLTFLPLGAFGKGISKASDAVGLTPHVSNLIDYINNSKLVDNGLVNGVKDKLGTMFTKNYGASPDLTNILDSGSGNDAMNQNNILNALKNLSQGHGLTPDELNQTGHVIEKTLQGTPEQQAFAQKWSDLADNGPQMQNGASPIGTNAMLHTASAVNGEPLLQSQLPDYFKHMYDNVPDELKGVFPKQEQGVSGLSPNGTFNLPRTFATLQDAQTAGLKPVLDPFQVLGSHLSQSSKALTNNEVISQIKNTPGILFPKDPIDEVAKLVKTGRMTADQAAQQLGMTLDDLKKGFVQSKVPQLSGAYIRPADEAALVEHLNPAQPTGPFALFNKLNNLFNKGYLLNPAPHLHNVYTNGVGLGDANVGYIKDTLDALKSGQTDPWYDRALQSGAMSNPTNGKFSDAIDRAVAPQGGNLLSRTLDATKGAASNIASGNGKLLDNLMAPFQPARNASHDLLWNNDAAIRTSLFRGAVENGATDAEAAAHTNKFMVDYNNLTPFEKQYVKPLINFYAWKKGNTPLQLSQTLAQTPKYALYGHAKDAISQALSGQPTDPEGRINSGNTLPDGSHTMVDPYSPMDEINKIGNKGLIQFIYNSLNPGAKEAITQGTSMLQAAGVPIQNKFPIYNNQAPLDWNLRSGLAHGINAMNPFGSSALLGQAGNPSNYVNKKLGMPTNNKPDLTMLDLITKLLGGFTATDNPGKDALNQHYQANDNQVNLRKYMKNVGKASN